MTACYEVAHDTREERLERLRELMSSEDWPAYVLCWERDGKYYIEYEISCLWLRDGVYIRAGKEEVAVARQAFAGAPTQVPVSWIPDITGCSICEGEMDDRDIDEDETNAERCVCKKCGYLLRHNPRALGYEDF